MENETTETTFGNEVMTDLPAPTTDILAIAKAVRKDFYQDFDVVFRAAVEAYLSLRIHQS